MIDGAAILDVEVMQRSAAAAEADAQLAVEFRDRLPNGVAIARDLDRHAKALRQLADFMAEIAQDETPGPMDDAFDWERFYRRLKAYFITRRQLNRTVSRSVPNVTAVGNA